MSGFRRGLAIVITFIVVAGGCSDAGPAGLSVPHTVAPAPSVASPAGRSPAPSGDARLLYDLREQIQRASGIDEALGPWRLDRGSAPRVSVRFSTDLDGLGTNAIRIDWPATDGRCREVSPSFGLTLPHPRPRRIYIQWKQHLGRTPTGGGVGPVGRFDLEGCGELDGRFIWTASREELPGLSNRRVDLRWRGDPAVPLVNVKRTNLRLDPNQGWQFLPVESSGEAREHTLYLKAESREGAGDGEIRYWVNGRLLMAHSGLALGAEAFRRMNFPWTMASRTRGQTEYFWDLVSWVAAAAEVTLVGAPDVMVTGDATQVSARTLDSHGADVTGHLPVRWSSSDTTILAIDAEGRVQAVGPGRATLSATVERAAVHHDVVVRRAGYYVSPEGTPDGDGSWDRPWDLETALAGADGRIQPGSTVWMRGGVYEGDFRSELTGTADDRIVVRQLPGERATVEGRLRVDGAFAMYWGFEIRQADALATDWPALEAYGPGTRYVNLVIHDAGENGISFRTVAGINEVHGCIIFNNGNQRGLDQGIYAPNDGGEKRITDNVVFNNMASGIQVFGDESHPVITDVLVAGNMVFNNSSIAATPDRPPSEENVTVGGDMVTRRVVVADNTLYFSAPYGQNLRVGLEPDEERPNRTNLDVVVQGNYVVGGATVFRLQHWMSAQVRDNTFIAHPGTRVVRTGGATDGVTWDGNVFHADPAAVWNHEGTRTRAAWRAATGLGAVDVVYEAAPLLPHVVVRPNRYERGRANIAIVNWSAAPVVAVDVSGVLSPGDRYEVRNVQDIFGAPVAEGTFTGAPLLLPTGGVQPVPAAGRPGVPPRTGPDFDVFVVALADPDRIR